MQPTCVTSASRTRLSVLAVLLLGPLLVGFVPSDAPPAAVGPQAVYFSATGHQLDNRYGFLTYWRANGQLLRFGYPLTEVIEEANRPVQYFERARLEYHAEIQYPPQRVLLGLLGREATGWQSFPIGAAAPGRWFPETGYTVIGKFLRYWSAWGGLAGFGYPISESYVETLPDGSTRAVQWFERGRLEYHPENVPAFYSERRAANHTAMLAPNEIQLGLIGREIASRRNLELRAVPPVTGVPEWAPALWSQRIDVDLSAQRVTAYEGELAVFSSGVSTGRDGFNTATGTFQIYAKLLYDDMTGTLDGEEYDVRKVPYVLYFSHGFALHGTYWHDAFGTGIRMSHGCVNLPLDRAAWLWNWAQPAWDLERAERSATYQPLEPTTPAEAELQPLEGLAIFRPGTPVTVHP